MAEAVLTDWLDRIHIGDCRLTEAQVAYLAGLIDGEGSIECQREMQRRGKTPRFKLRVSFTFATEEPLRTVCLWLGCRYSIHAATSANRSPTYRSHICKGVAVKVLRACLPYLLLKRRQAELILEIEDVRSQFSTIRLPRPGGGGAPAMPAQAIARMEQLHFDLRSLKSRKRGKRRPRDQWVIHRDTHKALITDVEAETLLSNLTTSTIGRAVSRAKAAASSYLLTGLLVTSDGRPWTGKDGRYYKLRKSPAGPGQLVPCEKIDRAVLAKITADFRSDAFVNRLLAAGRSAGVADDPGKPIREQMAQLEKEKARAAKFAMTVDDGGTFLRLIEERSAQISALRAELAAVEAETALNKTARDMTAAGLRELLLELGGAENALPLLLDRVTLDPDLTCRLYYRAAMGLSVASPRGFDRWTPTLEAVVRVA